MDFPTGLKKQSGSALVFAMGLCTLVVILATTMILALTQDMRRYDRLQETIIEQAAARSSAAWAIAVLTDEKLTDKIDQVFEFEINGVKVHTSLIDIDGLFNINTVIEKPAKERTYSPASILSRLSPGVADKITRPFETLADMRVALGLSQTAYDALVPYIRVNEPNVRAMNINGMPVPVLSALLSVEEGLASSLKALGPFDSESEVTTAMDKLAIQIPAEGLSDWLKYQSDQYVVRADIHAKRAISIYTLLVYTPDHGWRATYQTIGARP